MFAWRLSLCSIVDLFPQPITYSCTFPKRAWCASHSTTVRDLRPECVCLCACVRVAVCVYVCVLKHEFIIRMTAINGLGAVAVAVWRRPSRTDQVSRRLTSGLCLCVWVCGGICENIRRGHKLYGRVARTRASHHTQPAPAKKEEEVEEEVENVNCSLSAKLAFSTHANTHYDDDVPA